MPQDHAGATSHSGKDNSSSAGSSKQGLLAYLA
jgi:hypothetical protein